jgi:hypothetical protein
MDLQKLNVKIFVEQPNLIPLTEFIAVFHGWIQTTEGEYHDVADYSHMHAGPGIVLIASDANVSIEETKSRRGLLFCQKAPLPGSNREKIRHVVRSALEKCRKLEEEPALRGKLRFVPSEVMISVNDRLIGSNSDEPFNQIKDEVAAVARELFGGAEFALERDTEPRQRLNVSFKTNAAVDLRKALAILQ